MKEKKRCTELAKYRFTWPGDDESLICDKCVGQLKSVPTAMGSHLQIIPLSENDLQHNLTCLQIKG